MSDDPWTILYWLAFLLLIVALVVPVMLAAGWL